MIKKWEKSVFAVFIFTIVLVFTACGDKETSSNHVQKKEYVYQPSFQNIDTNLDYVSNICMKEEILYMFANQWVEDKKKNNGEGRQHYYFMSCALDGSNLQQKELEEFKEDEYVVSFTMDDNDKIRMITQQYHYNEETDESSQNYYIYTLDESGKIIESKELKRKKSKNPEEDYFYFDSRCIVFSNDKIYTAMDNKIYSFNETGKQEKEYEAGENAYIQNMISDKNGKIYIYGNLEENYGFREFNPETGTFGNLIELGDYRLYSMRAVHCDDKNRIYINDGSSVYCFDLSTGKATEEFNWLNSDMDGDTVSECFPLEDGKFLGISSSYDDSKQKNITELVTMNKVKSSEVKEKEIIRFSCVYLDYAIKNKILDFNKKNENYRIEVKTYDAYEDSIKQMNLDITSGNIPDILDLSNGISKEQLIKKDMFLDLYPLIEKDEELKKEDFIPSVLKTLESDGKLYYLSPCFSIEALISGKDIVGDKEGWSVDDMIKLYKNMPKDGVFMRYMAKQWFLRNIVAAEMNDYVDWSSGEVKFDSDDFVKLIEFSNNFPDEEEEMNYDESMAGLVRKGKLILNSFYLYDLQEFAMYQDLYEKQGGYVILSYPSEDKNNKLIMSSDFNALAITKQCENPDGAWEFIRQFYTYDYQKTYSSSYAQFPVRNDVLDKKLEYAQATKSYTDEDGTKVEPMESYSYDDTFDIKVGPLSKKQADDIRSIIDRVGICSSYDNISQDIFSIIDEEMEAFFAGDKSAKETAGVIQSRVKIYVSENS